MISFPIRTTMSRLRSIGPSNSGLLLKSAGGFAANPSLFRPRWTIGVPDAPLRLSHGQPHKGPAYTNPEYQRQAGACAKGAFVSKF